MTASQSVLLFGGSFDPIHHGHLIIARHVAEQLQIGRIILIPSRTPPHKLNATQAAIEHRLAMCRLAAESDTHFEVSDWEASRAGPNYTLHTIEHFRAVLDATADIHWLIGMDSLNELHTWYRAAELVDACTIVTAARPGSAAPNVDELARRFSASTAARLLAGIVATRQIDISSTDIRLRVRNQLEISYLVPPAVATYIQQNSLYR